MLPSKKWFPTSLQERAAWFDNFNIQFGTVGASLGFTAADVTSVGNDNQIVQFVATAAVELEAYREAVRQYRLIMLEGKIGETVPAFPANPTFAPPTGIPTGIFERLDNRVKRIRTSANYTAEIGALFGIIPVKPTPVPPDQMQPKLKAIAMPGSVVQVSFVRGLTDGVAIEMKLDNGAWADAGRFFKSPAEITVPQNAQSLPRSVQLRARYVEGNTAIGQFSAVVSTATQSE